MHRRPVGLLNDPPPNLLRRFNGFFATCARTNSNYSDKSQLIAHRCLNASFGK